MSQLNKQQQAVVDSNASRLLVLAGAGAGKTFTLVRKVQRLVELGADPSAILVLTFTNAAAAEMRSRFNALCPNAHVRFCTFHAFCFYILASDSEVRSKLGYTSVPSIITEYQLKKLEDQARKATNCTLTLKQLSGDSPCRSVAERRQLDIYNAYILDLRKSSNVLTFGILSQEITKLFIEDSPCIRKYKERYLHILVDEFQDTDPQQMMFLNSFTHSSFCFVGDALQSIYAFRGCSNEYIKSLSASDGWKVIKLHDNYRSTEEICEYANTFSRYADESYRIAMVGQRTGSPVEVHIGADASYQDCVDKQHCSILLNDLQNTRDSLKSVAILCRSNREVSYLKDYLADHGIVTEALSVDRHKEVHNILESCINEEFMESWLASLLVPEVYARYLQECIVRDVMLLGLPLFLSRYGTKEGVSHYVDIIQSIKRRLSSDELLVVKAVNILKDLGIDLIIDTSGCSDEAELIPFIQNYLNIASERSIYVGTIHSAKGLEYDTVYVMGVDDVCFPLRDEEMRNLFYVAITRPKHRLVVFKR